MKTRNTGDAPSRSLRALLRRLRKGAPTNRPVQAPQPGQSGRSANKTCEKLREKTNDCIWRLAAGPPSSSGYRNEEQTMTASTPVLKTVKALTVLSCLLMPSLTNAGEVTVQNCSNQDISFKVKSFNSTDAIKFVPASSIRISAGRFGRLKCATEECAIIIEYPQEIRQFSTLGTSPYMADLNYITDNYQSNPSRRFFCKRYIYNESGAVASLSLLNTGASSCSCP